MAFSTIRGRPRKPTPQLDMGTPETRLKHALRITAEPIDLCLEKLFITPQQHWCGLHLRWLYTLRYGAPSLTSQYADNFTPTTAPKNDDPTWRSLREQEYHHAIRTLKEMHYDQRVCGLVIYNESPAFLNIRLQKSAGDNPALATELARTHRHLCDGLDILVHLWQRPKQHHP